MGKYIVKRVLQFIPVFLCVTLILFSLQNIVPGDPIKLISLDKDLSLPAPRTRSNLTRTATRSLTRTPTPFKRRSGTVTCIT